MSYTYLIGWSLLNKYYYGVRYSATAVPEDLWVTYFTSSKIVKGFRIKHGEPDIVEIRKTFTDTKQAQLWEHKVLRRIIKNNRDAWLNCTDNIAIHFKGNYSNTIPGSIAGANKVRGKTYEELYGAEKAKELKSKRSIKSKQRWDDPVIRKKMSKKPEDTSAYREAALRRWSRVKKSSTLAGNGG